MTMKDEQIIRGVVGRMADEAPPALDVDELGDPLMKRRPDSTWGRSTRRRIAAVGAATAIIAVAVFLTVVVDRSAPDETTPVGASAEATVDEFNGALTAALDVLRETPGIEGVEESYIQTHLAGKVWFSTRANGDAVVVQQTDVDVRDSAWWLTAASPPSVGDNITTEARAFVDGEYYQASTSGQESQPWRQIEREPAGTLAFGLIFFDDEFGPELRNQIAPPDADVIRQDTANGGEIWSLNFNSNGANTEQRFHVHPDGHLASWTWQALGINVDPADPTVPIDSGNVSYTQLAEPRPLEAPEVGTELNLRSFDLPDGFLIEIDEHTAYVQEALEITEESFFRTDEVDWEPIREWAFGIVEDNPSTEGAYEAVEFALAALETPHTGFMRPGDTQDGQITTRPPPSGERLDGDIGYLDLPGITDSEQAPEYAGQVRQIMRELDASDPVCSWVLDLRESIGGSSIGDWLALGPLVGDDLLMRFGKGGRTQSVFYEGGAIRYEDATFSEGEAEVQERVPSDAYVPERLDVPIAVLISSRTTSAGEAIAITFAGRPSTRFFGEKTAGATIASEFHEMADGAMLRIPSGFYQDRTGHAYEQGLEPDTPVQAFRDSEDHVLNAAHEWLTTRQPCTG